MPPSPVGQEMALQTHLERELRCAADSMENAADAEELHPALEWAESGAMALTGSANGPPRLAPTGLAGAARRAARALHQLSGTQATGALDGAQLLGERAAIAGLRRAGNRSPGGTCRIIPAADGWIAVNLARPDDRELLPAWLGRDLAIDPWETITEQIRTRSRDATVARARLLGLPVAPLAEPPHSPAAWCRIDMQGRPLRETPKRAPRVLDLSALWAGPLCAHLLGLCGADVIKVESRHRPDGARFGPADFFDLLNAGKRSVALDLSSDAGRASLRELLKRADIVVESARPRALSQLGIEATEVVRDTPGLIWVSITGYGRQNPAANWVAFGDDAAAAAGLARAMDRRAPIFCGDAIADPLTGLHAAVAALHARRQGGGMLLDVPLSGVVRHVLASDPAPPALVTPPPTPDGSWTVTAGDDQTAVKAPRARPVKARARPLGADTEAVLKETRAPC